MGTTTAAEHKKRISLVFHQMMSSVWSAASAAAAKCPGLHPFWVEQNYDTVRSHRTYLLSQTMTDLQNEMFMTNPAFNTWAKLNDLRNPFIKCLHWMLAKPQSRYLRPVCWLKLDQRESVHSPLAINGQKGTGTGGQSLRRGRGLRTWDRIRNWVHCEYSPGF